MSHITSSITLYKNTKFFAHDNYKIDNINGFLDTLEHKTFSITREIKISLEQSFCLNIENYDNANITYIKGFNYVKIVNSTNNLQDTISTSYYFITNITSNSEYTFYFNAVLDVLNTYLGSLIFTSKTFVIREHVNRFNMKFTDIKNNCVYLLKNIPKNDNFPNQLSTISRYELMADTDNNNVSDSYWVRFIYKTNNKIFSCFIPYNNKSFEVEFYSESLPLHYTIQSFKQQLNFNNYNYSLFTDINIWNISVVPYAPVDELKNFYKENLIDLTSVKCAHPIDINNVMTIGFDFNETILEPINPVKLNLLRKQESLTINKLLLNFLFVKVDSIDKFDNLYQLNQNLPQERDYNLSESSILKSDFFRIKFSFGNFIYYLSLDNLIFKEDNLENFFKSNDEYKIVNFSYLPNFSVQKGISFFIKNGAFFNIINGNNNYNIEELTELPMFNDNYKNYLDSGNYYFDKQIYDNYKNLKILREQDYGGFSNTGMGLLTSYIRAGITSFYSPIIGAGRLAGALGKTYYYFFGGNQERLSEATQKQLLIDELNYNRNIQNIKFNNMSIKNTGNFESVLRNNVNVNFIVNIEKNDIWTEKKIIDYYYYFGNEINQYKIPTHNNRIYFDYLKCNAVFENYNLIMDTNIIEIILKKLSDGIIYIHEFKNKWFFDFNNPENMEVDLDPNL